MREGAAAGFDLAREIRERCYKEGDFQLASGARSEYYIDLKEMTLDGFGALSIARVIYERIKDRPLYALGGVELGSVPMSSAVATLFALDGKEIVNLIVRKERKERGTGKLIEGAIKSGASVALLEDVVSTGSSSIRAARALIEAGMKIDCVIALVDRDMGAPERFAAENIDYRFLYSIEQIRRA